jgi:hypothetical protein
MSKEKASGRDALEKSTVQKHTEENSPQGSVHQKVLASARALRPIHLGTQWLIATVMAWMQLSWASSTSQDQVITDIGRPQEVFVRGVEREPQSLLSRLLYARPLQRIRRDLQKFWLRKDVETDLGMAGSALRKDEQDAVLRLAQEKSDSKLSRWESSQILSHGAVVDATLDVLAQENAEAERYSVAIGKAISSGTISREDATKLTEEINPLMPATRSFRPVGHVVESDIDKDLRWVKGHTMVGLWIVLCPLFWLRIKTPRNLPEEVSVYQKLFNRLVRFKISLGDKLEGHHNFAWHVSGRLQARRNHQLLPKLKSTVAWENVKLFPTLEALHKWVFSWARSEHSIASAFSEESFRRLARSITWALPNAMRGRGAMFNLMEATRQHLQVMGFYVIHVAADSRKFGRDIVFKESNASNDPKMVNLLPIVPGDFVGIASAGSRTLSGLKHFGQRLVAIPASALAWGCAWGYKLLAQRQDHLPYDTVTYDDVDHLRHSVEYMIVDDHVISSIQQSLMTKFVLLWNKLARDVFIPMGVKEGVWKGMLTQHWKGLPGEAHPMYRISSVNVWWWREIKIEVRERLSVFIEGIGRPPKNLREFYRVMGLGSPCDLWERFLQLDKVSLKRIRPTGPHEMSLSVMPVMAYVKMRNLVRRVKSNTMDSLSVWDVLPNNAHLGEVGQYVTPTATPVSKKETSKQIRGKIRGITPAWDACTKERRAIHRSQRYLRKAETKFEVEMALDDESDPSF